MTSREVTIRDTTGLESKATVLDAQFKRFLEPPPAAAAAAATVSSQKGDGLTCICKASMYPAFHTMCRQVLLEVLLFKFEL